MRPAFKKKYLKVNIPMKAHGVEITLSPGTKNAKTIECSALARTKRKESIKKNDSTTKCIGRSLPALMLEDISEITVE